MSTDLGELKRIDLPAFLERHYDVRANGGGMARCPFHDDKNPSLSISKNQDVWLFRCHGCGAKGSILDFVMKKEGVELAAAADRIREMEGLRREKKRPLREHLYRDENGAIIYKKTKWAKRDFTYSHKEGDRWVGGKGPHPHVLYRWNEVKDSKDLVICEGERDADTLAALGHPATSADGGKGDQFKDTLPCFAGKTVRIIYDIGNEKDAEEAAARIATVAANVFLLTIPGKDPIADYEFDISDLLAPLPDDDARRDAFMEILAAEKRFKPPTPPHQPAAAGTPSEEQKRDPTMSFADLRRLDVHVSWAVDELVPEHALTVLYGRTSVGKSWLSLQIAEAVATGRPIFGKQTKAKPVVYCDYENPLAVMKDRAEVLNMEHPNTRLWHSTMDPGPPKLDGNDWELYKTILPPDSLLILDTSRTVHDGNDDASETAAKVMGRLRILRDLGHTIIILHHTPKKNDREIKASGAWADLADHTLCFYKLKGRGSQEEDQVGDIPLGAPLCVATGKKTRYTQPVPIYLTLAYNQGLVTDDDPDAETLDELTHHIAREGRGTSQSAVIKWLQDLRRNPDSKRTISREAVLRLLNRGETEKRWLGRSDGPGKPKRYEPLQGEPNEPV